MKEDIRKMVGEYVGNGAYGIVFDFNHPTPAVIKLTHYHRFHNKKEISKEIENLVITKDLSQTPNFIHNEYIDDAFPFKYFENIIPKEIAKGLNPSDGLLKYGFCMEKKPGVSLFNSNKAELKKESFDELEYIIKECNKRGLKMAHDYGRNLLYDDGKLYLIDLSFMEKLETRYQRKKALESDLESFNKIYNKFKEGNKNPFNLRKQKS